MITLTESAKAHIANMITQKGNHVAFRLWIKKTGCSGYMYMPEIVTEKKDTDVEIRESNILIYIDQEAMAYLKGTEIDYVKKSLGVSQLVFNNPNAEGVCGCGESFQIKSV